MKKILLSLFVGLIGLINFGYCDKVFTLMSTTTIDSSVDTSSYTVVATLPSNLVGKTVCFKIDSDNDNFNFISLGFRNVDYGIPANVVKIFPATQNVYFCMGANVYLLGKVDGGTSHLNGDYFDLDELLDTDLPILTENECISLYNLIPISSVDENYCVNNGLCPSGGGDCPGSGDNWSALYINNIQHLGKPIINVTIPDYIYWDYETNEDVFNLYVGSGYDQDYIDSVISINSYRPDTNDFTDIFVSGLTLIMPYIVILLFIVFIRKFIKRIFK